MHERLLWIFEGEHSPLTHLLESTMDSRRKAFALHSSRRKADSTIASEITNLERNTQHLYETRNSERSTRKKFYETVNNNLKKIENRIHSNRNSTGLMMKKSSSSTPRKRRQKISAGREKEINQEKTEKIINGALIKNTQVRIEKSRQVYRPKNLNYASRNSHQNLSYYKNRMTCRNDEVQQENGFKSENYNTGIRNSSISSRGTRRKYRIRKSDGSSYYKTVYFFPLYNPTANRIGLNVDKPKCDELTDGDSCQFISKSTNGRFLYRSGSSCAKMHINNNANCSNGFGNAAASTFYRSTPKKLAESRRKSQMKKNISRNSIEKQIDPFITTNPHKTQKYKVLTGTHPSCTCQAKRYCRCNLLRSVCSSKEGNNKESIQKRDWSFNKFFPSFKRSKSKSNSFASFSTRNKVFDSLLCWTCFQIIRDDESQSSVDSESGSDDGGDMNDGDGDDAGNTEDFNNQEDIEAIEYSSGGGDGDDNSSQDGNDGMQDDIINQEATNCNAVYDVDDCEDDEIEFLRKTGLEDQFSDDPSRNERQDLIYESLQLGQYYYDNETEVDRSESRATEDIENFFL